MNAVGKLGGFISDNQETIWALLVLLAVILVIVVAGKIIVSQHRKSALLDQIDKTVTEIHNTVGEIQVELHTAGRKEDGGTCDSTENKGAGVIYIDNRSIRQEIAGSAEENDCVQQPEAVKEAVSAVQQSVAEVKPHPEDDGQKEKNLKEKEISLVTAETLRAAEPAADAESLNNATEEDVQRQNIKFESLDSAVSRNGRSYTIEELEARIK